MWPPVSLISGVQLEFITSLLYLILHTVSQVYGCKLSNIERSRGVSVIHVATELHVSRQAIYMYDLKRAAARLPSSTTPPRKVGTNYTFL